MSDLSAITHAGMCVVADDTGNIFLTQRAFDETDAPDVAETWEFPGGGLEPGETPAQGAQREFTEETGLGFPSGTASVAFVSATGEYICYVLHTPEQFDITNWTPTKEVQSVAWVSVDGAQQMNNLRPEMADFNWDLVSGNQSSSTEGDMSQMDTEMAIEVEPEFSALDLAFSSIPIHGVLAPENTETGDSRGFTAGSVTSRPLPIALRHQHSDTGAHNGAVTVGSVDRMMRKDGLIHYEGRMMMSEEASNLAELIEFFGRYGVSVDGDKGSLDEDLSIGTGVMWFDALRAAGLTAVSIPAFAEAYIAFGPHPDMPEVGSQDELTLVASGNLVADTDFARGPGWAKNPAASARLHDYWMPGHPGGDKIKWGTPGDFARAKALIGEKIAKNSPAKLKYLNQIIAQWHHDALGYWPSTHAKMDRAGVNKAAHATSLGGEAASLETGSEPLWEAVLTSSAGTTVYPPSSYFERHPESGALVIDEPDENGIRRTYGYAGEWGVCHIGYDGKCVEVPEDRMGTDYAEFHLGRTRVCDGEPLATGLITYKVEHRNAKRLLSETASQAHYDNIANAWCAVRLGEDEHGVWFSGVVLPHVSEEDIILIEASGQVSGEWKYGALRGLQCVNIPGFPVMRSSAEYNDEGEVIALVASAHGLSSCAPTLAERMDALRQIDAEIRFQKLRDKWGA